MKIGRTLSSLTELPLDDVIESCIGRCAGTTQSVRALIGGRAWSKEELIAMLQGLDVGDWDQLPTDVLPVLLDLHALTMIDGRLDQVSARANVSVDDYLEEAIRIHREHVSGAPDASGLDLFEKAELLNRLRRETAVTHISYLMEDGDFRQRRERLIPRAEVRSDDLPVALLEHLHRVLQMELPESNQGYRTFFVDLMIKVVEVKGSPVPLLRALVDWYCLEGLHGLAFVLVVAPRKKNFREPWLLKSQDFFCYVSLHPSYNPLGKQLGNVPVLPLDKLHKAVYARMCRNKWKLATFCKPGQSACRYRSLPGDIGVHWHLEGEKGHASAGISTAIKLKLGLRIAGEERQEIYREFADLRFVRASELPEERFTQEELAFAISARDWLEVCLATMYAMNCEVTDH